MLYLSFLCLDLAYSDAILATKSALSALSADIGALGGAIIRSPRCFSWGDAQYDDGI